MIPPVLQPFVDSITWTRDVHVDVMMFLQANGRSQAIEQAEKTAELARQLAEQFQLSGTNAEVSGYLLGISSVVPVEQMAKITAACGLEILPAEAQFPILLTQKLSAVMAEHLFAVTNPRILEAIGCHQTLKMGTLPLDRLLFLANLLAGDLEGDGGVQTAVSDLHSLDEAVRRCCQRLWEQDESLVLYHPWFVDYCRLMDQV